MKGDDAIRQLLALNSWRAAFTNAKIVIFVDSVFDIEIVEHVGVHAVQHEIRRNERGTPFVSDAILKVESISDTELYCYINGDIVIPKQVNVNLMLLKKAFLCVGRRIDCDIPLQPKEVVDTVEIANYCLKLAFGTWRGSDYFLYKKGSFANIEDLVVGRPGWDNYMIYHAHELRYAVIDATFIVNAIHLNHEYKHVSGSRAGSHYGPEADCQIEKLGFAIRYDVRDSDYIATERGLRYAVEDIYVQAKLQKYRSIGNTRIVRKVFWAMESLYLWISGRSDLGLFRKMLTGTLARAVCVIAMNSKVLDNSAK
ncbi:MAG: hypothetical protein WAV84_00940 [Bacteroidota bacterium]